jgi:hypothetical protein
MILPVLRYALQLGWLAALAVLYLPACGGPEPSGAARAVPFDRVTAQPSGPTASYRVAPDGGDAWLIYVSMGEQRTGGFSIKIESVTIAGTAVTVTVRRSTPNPGDMTIQVLTYPSDAVRFRRSDLPAGELKVVFVSPEATQLAEQRIQN